MNNTILTRSSNRSEVTPKEYVVTLLTVDTDEYGAPWERTMNVIWDMGVIPNWHDWLKAFNELESEPYSLFEVIEVDPTAKDEI